MNNKQEYFIFEVRNSSEVSKMSVFGLILRSVLTFWAHPSTDLFFSFFPTWICLTRLATLIYLLLQKKYITKGSHLTFLNIYYKYSTPSPPA